MSSDGPLTVQELEVLALGILTHPTGQDRCEVRVLGDAVVQPGGAISVDGRGYPVSNDRGPGTPVPEGWAGAGGGHGGEGGVSVTGAVGGKAYGSIAEPDAWGSQGGDGNGGSGAPGGGVIRLVVNGRLTVDGRVSANGAVPDIGAYEFAEDAPSNIDLVVAGIRGSSTLMAGEMARVEWLVANRGVEPFAGPWHDAVYLRPLADGGRMQVAEPLVGHGLVLGPGQEARVEVELVEGGTGGFYAELKGPGTSRAGRETTWFITYGNRGLIDVPVPLVRFSAPGASEVRLYDSTLDWGETFTFLALHPDVLLPTLGPGQETTFEVRLKAMAPLEVELGMLTAEALAADATPFDWASLPAPPDADTEAWAAMLATLPERLGATVGEYHQVLLADLDSIRAGELRYSHLANLNGQWLFGEELAGEEVLRPIIEIPPEEEDPAIPALHNPPAKIPGDGIRRTWWVVIHISDYTGRAGASTLRSVRKDWEDVATYLRTDLRVPEAQWTGGLDVEGDNASWNRTNVETILRSFRGKIDADDNLVISYSGHGGQTRSGAGYMALNGGSLSPVAFGRLIDEIGAGTTYLINDSCHSEGFNRLVNPANTKFVGLGASKLGRVSWGNTAKGGALTSALKGRLRACNTLGKSMDLATAAIVAEYKDKAKEQHRQHPVLTNPSGVALNGKMWADPSGFQQQQQRVLNGLRFNPLVAQLLGIVGSIDPNDKYALAGAGPEGWVNPDQVLPFEVVFENKAVAGAPAQEILVIDDLDPRFDWSTFELRSIAFNDATLTVPSGLQRYTTTTRVGTDPNDVAVQATFNPATGRLEWLMRSVDPATGDLPEDPFAGFLPPNDESRRGEGSLTYTIRPRLDLPDGTQLTNFATIIFDPTYGANPPILTPTVTNSVDGLPPTSTLLPLPAQQPGEIAMSWAGEDAPDGSGIASYDIYVSRDGAPYTAWLLATTETTARFFDQPGGTYRLYSVARDAAGNTEPASLVPDAEITVGGGLGRLDIRREAEGAQLRIAFQGVLQSAPSVRGPWTDVPGASSPYLTIPVGAEHYYRARE